MGYFDDDPRVFNGRTSRGTGRGSDHRLALLTEDQVREIKRVSRLPRGQRPSRQELADTYGVKVATIASIRRGETWGHVRIEEDA
jgi:hypothetical protein